MATLPRILVAEDLRSARLGLLKHLAGRFEVREEADGESAWQALVADESILAVISDLKMPKLNGFELLERLRASRLRRLKEMPLILVSGEESEEDRQRAKAMGVSDFVTKAAGAAEIQTRLNHLLALTEARNGLESGREQMVQDPFSGLFTAKFIELQAAKALSHAARHGGDVSVLVLGFDALAAVREQLGNELTEQVAQRFAKMLAGKMRQEDSLGHFGPGQYAIISPGTSPVLSSSFAERVREAVAVARVTVQGKSVALTVSLGVASVPQDRVTSAGGLLDLALRRMQEAVLAGGNQIVVKPLEKPAEKVVLQSLTVPEALKLIAAKQPSAVQPHLAALAGELLPLLHLINQEWALDLPLAVLETRLSDPVKL
jgi:diguanylate cyclase (GGDEF)-like protein